MYVITGATGNTGKPIILALLEAGKKVRVIKSDVSLSAIATKDIAGYASKRLPALDFEGNNVQNLLGARDVTYAKIAKTYGASVGKSNLEYVEFSYADFKKALMGQMGLLKA